LCNLLENENIASVENHTKTGFIELYEPIHNQFCRFCRAISGNTEDSEDLIQDTILNALVSFDKIRDKLVFKSYMFSVAINLNRMKQRKLKFTVKLSDEETKQVIHYVQDQEYLTDFKIIYEKILSLPHRMAETIILFYISDLPIDEIQRIQGGSLSGVKLRLKRGRDKLISLLNTPEQIKMAQLFLTF
jgi:RNA polymerase sigma factor (sigma-70 family)